MRPPYYPQFDKRDHHRTERYEKFLQSLPDASKPVSMEDRLSSTIEHGKKVRIQQELIAGYVYLFKCDGFIKIGKARNVQERIDNIQCGNPHEVTLLASVQSLDPFSDEEELHRIYQRFRVRGEWFKIPEELIPALLELFCQKPTMFPEAYPIKRRPRKGTAPASLPAQPEEKESLV